MAKPGRPKKNQMQSDSCEAAVDYFIKETDPTLGEVVKFANSVIKPKKAPVVVLISLSGVKTSGKTTVANMGLESGGTSKVSFASTLKRYAKKMFVLTDEQLFGEDKEKAFDKPMEMSNLDMKWLIDEMYKECQELKEKFPSMQIGFDKYKVNTNRIVRGPFLSPRDLLQKLGTEIMQTIHKSFSPEVTLYKVREATAGIYFVDDLRFSFEMELAKKLFPFYYPIKIVGRNDDGLDKHASENEWKTLDFFATINNNGTLADLKKQVDEVFALIQKDIQDRRANGENDAVFSSNSITQQQSTLKVGQGTLGRAPLPTPIRI